MSEPQEKILAFDNQFHEFGTQTVQGVECVSTPFPVISSDANTLTLELTGLELRELLSSIQVGAEWAYPDKSHQILFNFMKGLICAPVMQEEGDCANYLPYAPFAEYSPQNPYNEPDLVPPNYLIPPFMRNTGFEYPEIFGYKASDIFVPFGAVNIAPENVFTLNYPQIKISVRGSGQIELDLLSVQAGGFAVLKVGSPPNILDILQELIIETGVVIIDLENDSASIPPESDIVIAEEINIDAAVNETTDVYVVFIPKLNDSLNALGFGGGIRSIGLCGFEQDAMMAGIEDVRYNEITGGLDKRIDGVWTEFATCEQLVACAPEGGGGGGGGLLVSNYEQRPANATTSSTSFVDAAGFSISHNFTKANAYIEFRAYGRGGDAGTIGTFRLLVDSIVGDDAIEVELQANTSRTLIIGDVWSGLTTGSKTIKAQFKTANGANNVLLSSSTSMSITVIEFDDSSDIFVEDMRIVGRELQKKIGGVWITVSDSLNALFASIDSQIASIISVNNTQASQIASIQSVNSTQNTRLTALESRATDLELDAAAQAVTLADHESRIDALEAAAGITPIWFAYSRLFSSANGAGNWSHDGTMQTSFLESNSYILNMSQSVVWASQRKSYMIVDFRTEQVETSIFVEFLGIGASPIEVWAQSANTSTQRRYIRIPEIGDGGANVAIRFSTGSQVGKLSIVRLQFIGLTTMFSDGD